MNTSDKHSDQPDLTRRRLIIGGVGAIAVLAAGEALSPGGVRRVTAKIQDSIKDLTACGLESDTALVGNSANGFIHLYAHVYETLKAGEFVIYDQQGKIIVDIHHWPKGWDDMSASDKEIYRKRVKARVGREQDIPASTLTIMSPHIVLSKLKPGETILSDTISNMNQVVIGDDDKRTRKQYLEDTFKNPTGNCEIDAFVSQHIAGLVGGESRFDNTNTSSAGALGIIQIMPHNIINRRVNPNKYTQAEVNQSFRLQAELARNLMQLDYRDIVGYTDRIADTYFDGDKEKANTYFMGPLLFNSYNTGLTLARKVINGFITRYPSRTELLKAYDRKDTDDLGFDIFWMFTRYGYKHHQEKDGYGDHSSNYVWKSIGMSQAISKAESTRK